MSAELRRRLATRAATRAGGRIDLAKASGARACRGFTLLEVLVALTIAGMALGGLFSVIGGNKRLAWRSEEALVRTMDMRSLINQAQLDDTRGELLPARVVPDLRTESDIELPEPEDRAVAGSVHKLRGYELRDANGDVVASGSYWVELDTPE
ncbi:MAG TPA: type II secretion system protein [Pseudomonadales bacterium]